MPNKKSFKSDLERRRFIFFSIGCIAALSLSWVTLDLLATTEKTKTIIRDEPETATVSEYTPPETDIKPEVENKAEIIKDNTEILFKIVDNAQNQTFEGFFPQDVDPDMPILDWDGPEVVDAVPDDDEPLVFVEKMPEFPGGNVALNDYLRENLVYPAPAKEAGAQGTVLVEVAAEEPPVRFVEQMPEFPGGMPALNQYLRDHLQYPAAARDAGAMGTVLVEFVVERDGSVSNATVKVSQFPALDEEALRVVRSLPKWKPGEANGRKVRVYYNVPIRFSLQ